MDFITIASLVSLSYLSLAVNNNNMCVNALTPLIPFDLLCAIFKLTLCLQLRSALLPFHFNRPQYLLQSTLIDLQSSIYNSDFHNACSVPQSTYHSRQRPRGTRAGLKRKKKIQRVTPRRPAPLSSKQDRGCVSTNLLKIKTTDHRQCMNRQDRAFVKIGLLNARSVEKKTALIHDLIVDKKCDIYFITETWISQNNPYIFPLPSGYKCFQFNRINRGGGIMAIYKQNINLTKTVAEHRFDTFELLETIFRIDNNTYTILCIYRPPPSKRNKLKTSDFIRDFESFMYEKHSDTQNILILGDLNIHFNKPNDSTTKSLLEILDSFGLTQHVTEPTHISGNTLDVVISDSKDDNILSVDVEDCSVADHSFISTKLKFNQPEPVRKEITYRKTKHFDHECFEERLVEDGLVDRIHAAVDVDGMVDDYNNTVMTILEEQCPRVTRNITIRPNKQWYTEELRLAKQQLRKAERTWRKSKLEIHRQIYLTLKRQRNSQIKKAYNDHIKEQLISQKGNLKDLYRTINTITKQEETLLPTHTQPKELANTFMDFFDTKISNIRKELDDVCLDPQADSIPEASTTCPSGVIFDEFTLATEKEIDALIKQSPNKTCPLDPIPTWIVKKCDIFVPIFTMIVNVSLSTGKMPECLKQAMITPLIKKSSLDQNIFKNYRPVSNLSFLSKIIEKVVAKRMHTFLNDNSLFSKMQSAYRSNHSTETALVRVFNDIIQYLDKGNSVVLILLDLSAAFDTIDQEMLINRLRDVFKLNGNALNWFISYLSGREQYVAINRIHSSSVSVLKYGVPQGSVLGPLLYTLYTKPLCDLISTFDISHHLYADDTQLYFPVNRSNITIAVRNAENCLKAIKDWMTHNKLKLNEDKTEIIQISKNSVNNVIVSEINLADTTIKVNCNSIKNLGVLFDKELNMRDHVTKVIQSCNFMLKRISRIRHVLDKETTNLLICSFIFSRLDYCNSLLTGVPKYVIDRLQKVQNRAARLTTLTNSKEHITPTLQELHWLPVEQRIKYKILCNVFKCIHNSSPDYLREMVDIYQPPRRLRSSEALLLDVPKRINKCNSKSFSCAAPVLWNGLSFKTKSAATFSNFKTLLKTELFKEAYHL